MLRHVTSRHVATAHAGGTFAELGAEQSRNEETVKGACIHTYIHAVSRSERRRGEETVRSTAQHSTAQYSSRLVSVLVLISFPSQARVAAFSSAAGAPARKASSPCRAGRSVGPLISSSSLLPFLGHRGGGVVSLCAWHGVAAAAASVASVRMSILLARGSFALSMISVQRRAVCYVRFGTRHAQHAVEAQRAADSTTPAPTPPPKLASTHAQSHSCTLTPHPPSGRDPFPRGRCAACWYGPFRRASPGRRRRGRPFAARRA